MADVTISDLNLGVPAGSHVIPYSTGTGGTTNKTLVSSLTAGLATNNDVRYIGCVVSNSTAQVINGNAITILNFNSETIDTDSFHNNTTNNSRITIPSGLGGMYLIIGTATTSTTTAYIKNSILIFRNGVAAVRNDTSIGGNGVDVGMNISYLTALQAGDYIELAAFCQSFWSQNQVIGQTLSLTRIAP